MNALRVTAPVLLALLLSSCGFALRGSDVLSGTFDSLQYYAEQPNSELSRLLSRSLAGAEIDIIPVSEITENSQIPLIGIAGEQLASTPVTINPRARAAQIELRLSAVVALSRGGNMLIEPETLFVERTYFQDVENISGNQEEAEIIAQELRRELVDQIMRRLAAVEL